MPFDHLDGRLQNHTLRHPLPFNNCLDIIPVHFTGYHFTSLMALDDFIASNHIKFESTTHPNQETTLLDVIDSYENIYIIIAITISIIIITIINISSQISLVLQRGQIYRLEITLIENMLYSPNQFSTPPLNLLQEVAVSLVTRMPSLYLILHGGQERRTGQDWKVLDGEFTDRLMNYQQPSHTVGRYLQTLLLCAQVTLHEQTKVIDGVICHQSAPHQLTWPSSSWNSSVVHFLLTGQKAVPSPTSAIVILLKTSFPSITFDHLWTASILIKRRPGVQ